MGNTEKRKGSNYMIDRECIIKERLMEIDSQSTEYIFLKIYNASIDGDSGIEELDLLFACYHQMLFNLIKRMNDRFDGNNRHITAKDCRDLIYLIDGIEEIERLFRGTCYYFTLDPKCSSFLKQIRPFLKNTNGTDLPYGINLINIPKYDKIFFWTGQSGSDVKAKQTIQEKIQMVSTRGSTFDQMEPDEKLENLANVIEYLLKKNGKYEKVDSDEAFCGLVTNDGVKDFRSRMQCFRHVTKADLKKRKSFTQGQKEFLANYGLTICMAILDNSKEK